MAEYMPLEIVQAVKNVLATDPSLSYVDKVTVQKYRRDTIPDFENYCIIISPQKVGLVAYPAASRFVQVLLYLVLLAKQNYGEEDALMADDPTATPPNVGLFAMYEDVIKVLYNNNLGDALEISPGIHELDEPADFNVLVEEGREGFIMEGLIVYSPRGHRFIDVP